MVLNTTGGKYYINMLLFDFVVKREQRSKCTVILESYEDRQSADDKISFDCRRL